MVFAGSQMRRPVGKIGMKCFSGYQLPSTGYGFTGAGFEAVAFRGAILATFKAYQSKINNRRMERGGNPAKKEGRRLVKGELRKFFDREFDWIALLLIAAMILVSLVFF